MSADEQRFCAANRGRIQQHAEVRSKAKAPWVRVAMSVAKNQVGRDFQARENFEKSRRLTETEQAGNVWKTNRALAPDPLDFAHFRIRINDHPGDSAFSLLIKSQICASDILNAG